MELLKGKTLKDTLTFRGVGIHTGEVSEIKVHPSDRRGIYFYTGGVYIPAHHRFVVNTVAGTDLGRDGRVIKTVEHLMAAFYLSEVDSAVVEITKGWEIPILDGSAKPFYEAFQSTGFVELNHTQKVVKITEQFEVRPNGNFALLEPYNGELFVFEGVFPHVGRKRVVYNGKPNEALLGARTFCRLEDIEALKANNLGLGGTLLNTLVLDRDLTHLVYSSEPAYHKLLDFIGDIALLGARIVGKIYIFNGNHRLNHAVRDYLLKRYLLKTKKTEKVAVSV